MKFQKIFQVLVMTVAVSLFASCKSVVVDPSGGIPDEDIPYAKVAIGSYQGPLRIFGTPVIVIRDLVLSITLQGNRPILSASPDLLGPGCQSSIGQLQTLEVGGAWDAIASFEFDPGLCAQRAQGRRVVFYINRNGQALFTLLKKDLPASGRRPPSTIELRASLRKVSQK
jgi:hypothetical protein